MRYVSVALFLTLVIAFTPARADDAAKPLLGDWGIETQFISSTIKPGDDFYRYVNEGWLNTAAPPPGMPYANGFVDAYLRTQDQLQRMIDDILSVATPANTDDAQIAALYDSFVDMRRRNELGLAPVQGDIDAIMGAANGEDLARLTARPLFPSTFVAAGVLTDSKHPTRYVATVLQSGLSLPSPEYYLAEGEPYATYRTDFVTYAAGVFTRAGIDHPDERAKSVLALETAIARLFWTPAEQRDPNKSYHLMTRAELNTYAPGFPWDAFFDTSGMEQAKDVVLKTDTATKALAELYGQTDLDVLKSHLALHYLNGVAGCLTQEWDAAQFDFFAKELSGIDQEQSIENRAQSFIHLEFGEILGRAYATRYFPASSRALMDEMIDNLRAAYRARIASNGWMDEATRAQALIKLDAVASHVGYPDKWRDWSSVTFDPSDLIGNRRKIAEFELKDAVAKLGEPRRDWQFPYSTVEINAGYLTAMNSITFPAGILQPPFFDPNADPAVNYGSIGAVIGHELGHAFDDQGSQFDETGALRNWWTDAARAEFDKRTAVLVGQFNQFEGLPGLNVNGALTLGENIGDLAGLTVAYDAYQMHVAEKDGGSAPVIDGFTGDQRFFLAWAQLWRDFSTPAVARQNLLTDPHSPGEFRANGAVRNVDGWYDAFGVKEGDALYLAPDARVQLW